MSTASHKYGAYVGAQKNQDREASKQRKKHCIKEKVDAMKRKKKKMLESTINVASPDAYAEKAEAENDVAYIGKSNKLRKAAKKKTGELHLLPVQIQQRLLEFA